MRHHGMCGKPGHSWFSSPLDACNPDLLPIEPSLDHTPGPLRILRSCFFCLSIAHPMRWYAEFFRAHRGLVVAMVALLSLVALLGITRLGFDDVPRGLFSSDEEDYQRLDSVYRDFGADDNDVVLLLERETNAGWFDQGGVAVLRKLEQDVAAVEGVEFVAGLGRIVTFRAVEDSDAGLFNSLFGGDMRPLLPDSAAAPEAYDSALTAATEHPLAQRLVSEDGRTALLVARLDRSLLGIPQIEGPVAELQDLAAAVSALPGMRARVTGVPPVRISVYRILPREQVQFLGIGALLCSLLAFWIFRDMRAVLATMVGPVMGAFWALGFAGLLGQKVDLLSAVLPELAIVIGFTDSVHLMMAARKARSRGMDPLGAASDTILHLGMPCFLTSITTGIGFASLLFADVPIIQRFGLMAAVAVGLTFLSVLTTLPLLVSWMGKLGTADTREKPASRWSHVVEAVARRVVAAPLRVAIVGVIATIACLALATRLEPENRLTEALPRGGEAYGALLRAEEVFGGILPAYVLVEWDPESDLSDPEAPTWRALADVDAVLSATPLVYSPVTALDLAELLPRGAAKPLAALEMMPKSVSERLWRPDLGRTLVNFQVPDGGAELTEGIFGKLVQDLAELEQRHPSVQINLTGTDFVARAQVNRMILSLATSLALAVLVIFGVLSLEFRSLGLGLVSLLPNLFPLVVVAALLVLFGHPMQMASAVLFTILLGLAVDDTIHLLARYRREGGRAGGNEAIVRATTAVGEAIGFTTLVLFAGFGVVAFSVVPTNQLFAVMTCLGLLAALVGDLILLPALLALRGRRGAPPQA